MVCKQAQALPGGLREETVNWLSARLVGLVCQIIPLSDL